MRQLTERQHRAFDAILRLIQAEERPPTLRELAAELRCHVKTVYQYIQALERKGCIERRRGRIRVAPELRPEAGVPIVGRVAAGAPITAIENREGTLSLDGLFGQGDLFAVRVAGDSMGAAGILDGDWVVVRAGSRVPPGAIAVCYLGEAQEATVKRLWERGDAFELVPANEAYRPVRVPRGDPSFRVGGLVVGVVRRLR